MNFNDAFSAIYYLNLGERDDRRARSEEVFFQHQIPVKRFPAIHRSWVRNKRGHENPGRYALTLTQRLAIRKAKMEGHDSVLLFEDDVVLRDNFLELFSKLDIPDDWGLLYLGCAHAERPTFVSPGVVKCTNAIDTHAIAIRKPFYDQVLNALASPPDAQPDSVLASDRILASLQEEIPSYAAFPNLAWQRLNRSDLLNREACNYDRFGDQRFQRNILTGLAAQNVGATRCKEITSTPSQDLGKDVKVAFLFLTIKDLFHSDLWAEYFQQAETGFSIHAHAKRPDLVKHPLLRNRLTESYVDTKWGDISLVQATCALLHEALADPSNTHFILCSDSCVPTRPLQNLLHYLHCDPRNLIEYETCQEVIRHPQNKVRRSESLPLIPKSDILFQSQWMLLRRDAVETIIEYDLTNLFSEMFSPDEVYFSTILKARGYPFEKLTKNCSPCWTNWAEIHDGHPDEIDQISFEQRGEWLAGPHFLARKVPAHTDVSLLFDAIRNTPSQA